ncbi:MAG: phosphoribosyltransferase family protein [candidate division SR1 bacterium]|nr:phosphoribosyltransferase family protein [candidate division SR1 bacterium]
MTFNLIDYLFPRQCINCGIPGAYLCINCKRELQPHPEICPYCHRTSKDYLSCIECRTNKNNSLEGIIIPFAYTKLLKTLIIKLKYFHKKDITSFLIDRLAIGLQANESLQKELYFCPPFSKEGWCEAPEDLSYKIKSLSPAGFSLYKGRQNKGNSKLFISFVPSHRYRNYFIKGYNQSELLARELSKKLGVPMISLANKYKHTKTQASLDRNGRLHNLKNAFTLKKNLPFKGDETLFIIDDITTTGSTINELGKLVKQTYPKIKIRGMVLGRHMN